MKTIWKTTLQLVDNQTIELPEGHVVLSVMNQRGKIVLYAEVNPEAEQKAVVPIAIYGTGNPVPEAPGRFVGTVTTDNEQLVWHVYVSPTR
ncbi:hypothetical protein D3C80_755210 [compost metagenome]